VETVFTPRYIAWFNLEGGQVAQIIPKIVHDVFEGDEDPVAIRAYSHYDHWLSAEEFETSFASGDVIQSLSDYEVVASFEMRFVRFIETLRQACPLHEIQRTLGTVKRAPVHIGRLFHGYRMYIERSQTMSFYAPRYQLVVMLSYDLTILVFGARCNLLEDMDRTAERLGLHVLPINESRFL
jgi:hypothetical protein